MFENTEVVIEERTTEEEGDDDMPENVGSLLECVTFIALYYY